jgi:hypothetical protein
MAATRAPKPPRERKPPKPLERKGTWIAGLRALGVPAQLDRPDSERWALYFWNERDVFRHLAVGERDELLALCAEAFELACRKPMTGRAHRPLRVRTECEALARVLLGIDPELEVAREPTPEDAEVREVLVRMAARDACRPYLPTDASDELCRRFFAAAAKLEQQAKWHRLEDEIPLLDVDVEGSSVDGGVLRLFAGTKAKESCGFALYDDADHLVESTASFEGILEKTIGPSLSILFLPPAEIAAPYVRWIEKHGYAKPSSARLPLPEACIDDKLIDTSVEDLELATVLCLALAEALVKPERLRRAWHEGVPYRQRVEVKGPSGRVVVELRAPSEAEDALAEALDEEEDDDEAGQASEVVVDLAAERARRGK